MSTSKAESDDCDKDDSDIETGRGYSEAVTRDNDSISIALEIVGSGASISGKRSSKAPDQTEVSSTQILADRKPIKRKRISADSNSPSIASWNSILSVVRRGAEPMASSTPLVPAKKLKTQLETEYLNTADTAPTEMLQASSISTTDDSIVYYGAPLPGTAVQHRQALFREAFSLDDGSSPPSPQRVQEAPNNPTDFVPKLTSTGIDGQELSLPQDGLPESPII